MNPTRTLLSRLFPWRSAFRPQALLASIALISVLPASAAEFTYQYYRFKPTKINNSGTAIQLSEFTFSRAGTLLNLNNRNGSGVNSVPVTVTSAGQGTTGGQDPPKVADGLPLANGGTETKWFRNGALTDGNELIFNFGSGVTVDSYNFATGGDSTVYSRTPVSWRLAGSNDGTNWTLLDVRSDVISTIANLTYQAGYTIPADIPPVINSYTVPSAIVLNSTPVTFSWNTQYSTDRNLYQGANVTNLPAEIGTLTVTPPANSTTAYTYVATKAGSTAAVNTINLRTVQGGTSTYRYVRYTITGRRGGTASNLVQMSEFAFYDTAVSAVKLPITAISNPGGSNTDPAGGEYITKLIDGNNATKWLDGNNKPVIFDFGSAVSFNSYSFVTGNDAPDRDAIRWKMEGSNDSLRWDLIENVNFDYSTTLTRNATSNTIPLPGPSLPVQIEYFTGNTKTLIEGDTLTLSYSTQAASSVSISPSPGASQPLYGSVTVTPTADTTYTLTATPLDVNAAPITATFSVFVIPDPGVNTIGYDDFASAGVEVNLNGSTTITPSNSTLPGRLRLTPEAQGRSGTAWFLRKQDVTGGFEATFGLSLNQEHPNNFVPADGLAFVVQNSPSGTGDAGTGENGVSQNALNICFHTFGFAADPASVVEIRSGTTVLARSVTYNKPGVELYGIPGVDANGNILTTGGFPYTLGSLASDPPYQIRVVYMPHDLDVYLDGIAILQNVNVDLSAIGAADASGKSYFGFTARTGGNIQNSDITSWHVKLGDYSALPPFGIVKTLFKYTPGNPRPTSVDLVWNASFNPFYDVVSSLDLETWDPISTEAGVDGQIGKTINIPFAVGTVSSAFFRVEENTGN